MNFAEARHVLVALYPIACLALCKAAKNRAIWYWLTWEFPPAEVMIASIACCTKILRPPWGSGAQDTDSLQSETICAIFSRNFRFHVYIGNTLKIDSIAVTIINKVKQFGILKFLHVLAVPTLEFLSWMPVPNHVCQLQLSLTYMICFRIHKHFEYGYDGYRYKLLCNLDL